MEHYIQDRAKIKAIALYTFKHITPAHAKEVPTVQVLDALKATLFKYDPHLD